MNIWHDINIKRITPEKFCCCIEISKGSKKKYELDKETGLIVLDRILTTSMQYPANYGFIPKTYSEDNDPLDVLVLSTEVIDPLVLVDVIPIGVMKMIDNGENDEKIIGVCAKDPFFKNYNDIKDLPKHLFDEISHFFTVYKQLENKKTEVLGFYSKDEALKIIKEAIERYNNKFKNLN